MAKLEPWLGLSSGADGVKDGPSVVFAPGLAIGLRSVGALATAANWNVPSKPMQDISGLAQDADVKTVIGFFGSRISSKRRAEGRFRGSQALACGVPVIGSKLDRSSEALLDGRTGFRSLGPNPVR
jgi:hypothetical protein